MLINHPTDGATCVFVLSNRHAVLHIDAMFIMAAICISVELYEIVDGTSHFDTPIDICGEILLMYSRLAADVRVWRRCSVVVDCWRCRPDIEGGQLIRLIFMPKNLLSGLR